MQRSDFAENFLWGAATASYQIEGAVNEGGRGPSIWDTFSHTQGKTANGETGDIACDHYHLYKADFELLKQLNVNTYRFSLAWSRILPQGYGAVNEQGIDFYNRVIDCLLEKGIEPAVTLYHWDLPQGLQDLGGWANRDTVERFAEYAELVYKRFGDRVHHWFTHNEPWVASFAGNLQGRHAPGIKNIATATAVSHHLLLSHARAVASLRNSAHGKNSHVGVVLNLYPCVPASDSEDDAACARLADSFQNRWFLDPLYKASYPSDMYERFESIYAVPPVKQNDLSYIAAQKTDFLGVNYYFRKVVRKASADELGGPDVLHPILPYVETKPKGAPYTAIGWEVWPEGLKDLLLRLKDDYGNPAVQITENGAAFADEKIENDPVYGETVADDDRADFIKNHIQNISEAVSEGCRVHAYY
ncbi:MAG: GH1 family beta-glucosidase, partial [Treponema socranskii subsp. buccale]